MKLSLTNDELASLADGQLPVSVIGKAKAKLKPKDPIAGQLDLVKELAKEDDMPRDLMKDLAESLREAQRRRGASGLQGEGDACKG